MARRFRGEIVQKVDGKGRVSIPAAFRRVLEQGDPDWTEGLRPELVLAYGGQSQKYIEGYTVRAMEDIENAIEAMPYGDDRSAMEMNYSTKSLQMNIDDTGRIIFQKRIKINEYDTGGSLYMKVMLSASESFEYVFDRVCDNYKGVPQKHLNDRVITVNRGRCLGGSSSINGMIYIRGNKNDYDNWEKMGCKGWSYNDVLPIFKKLEKDQTGGDPKYHSKDGEWPIVMPQEINKTAKRFVKSGAHIGLSLIHI